MKTDEETLILIVDDKAAVRYVTERVIRGAGFRTAEAACGEEALVKAAALRPDLILLDINMPDLDGYEVCRRIRRDEAMASVGIVMISATFESAEHRVRGLEGGADTFLVAPVEPGVLVATVRAMLRLKRAEAQLREFDRRKDEFLATLAHELRNPLAPLLYCIELVEPRVEDDDLRSTVAIMRRQSEHLIRLVDDLVDMSRITQNKLALRLEPITLQDVITTAVDARRAEIAAKHQTLTVDVPSEPIQLYGDPVRLAQVFGNLVSNSIKYTGAGGHIGIAARIEGPLATVSVTDDGVGILREDLKRIFGLFVQARHPAGGLGIGLALAHRIVQMHNGTISASSEGLHRGSTFTVRLPVVPFAEPPSPGGDQSADLASSEPMKIVVVDDNVDSVDAMAILLTSMGHDVRTGYDGWTGLEICDEFEPDLVFVDITMPGISGYETVAQMRARPWSERALICTLSGHGQMTDRERSEAAGAHLHLVKPIGRADLERIMHEARARQSSAQASAALDSG